MGHKKIHPGLVRHDLVKHIVDPLGHAEQGLPALKIIREILLCKNEVRRVLRAGPFELAEIVLPDPLLLPHGNAGDPGDDGCGLFGASQRGMKDLIDPEPLGFDVFAGFRRLLPPEFRQGAL